jgi:hypothetical protein
MTITVDSRQLDGLRKAIEGTGRKLPAEFAIAINKTATKCKGIMAKQVSQQIKVTQAVVKQQIKTGRKANKSYLTTTVRILPKARISLRDFGAKQTKAGVTYQIARTGQRRFIPSGFIVDSLGGHVFQRRGKDRTPIDKRFGPSSWGVFVKGKARAPSVELTQEELQKQIDKRIQFINFRKTQG